MSVSGTSGVTDSVLDKINGKTSTQTANEAGAADRFLKLLVAQMQNQDPLNPMDNAQVTTQMAQIQTVTGIETLNDTVSAMSGHFLQMQALQSASLVGRNVVIEGDKLAITEDGMGFGGFELGSAADNVKVEILSPSGQVIDTVQLGAAGEGLHSFNWEAGETDTSNGLRFRVTATSGGVSTDVTELMQDRVGAVSMNGSEIQLELLLSGTLPYGDVKSFN